MSPKVEPSASVIWIRVWRVSASTAAPAYAIPGLQTPPVAQFVSRYAKPSVVPHQLAALSLAADLKALLPAQSRGEASCKHPNDCSVCDVVPKPLALSIASADVKEISGRAQRHRMQAGRRVHRCGNGAYMCNAVPSQGDMSLGTDQACKNMAGLEGLGAQT